MEAKGAAKGRHILQIAVLTSFRFASASPFAQKISLNLRIIDNAHNKQYATRRHKKQYATRMAHAVTAESFETNQNQKEYQPRGHQCQWTMPLWWKRYGWSGAVAAAHLKLATNGKYDTEHCSFCQFAQNSHASTRLCNEKARIFCASSVWQRVAFFPQAAAFFFVFFLR